MQIGTVLLVGGFIALVTWVWYMGVDENVPGSNHTQSTSTQSTSIQSTSTEPTPNAVCQLCQTPIYMKHPHSAFTIKNCASCQLFQYRLHGGHLTEAETDPSYAVQVTYKVVKQEHDGYCSDPYDESQSESMETHTFQYPSLLKPEDFNEHNLTNSTTLMYFERAPEAHGNGYCGLETTYELISAKRVPV